LSIALASKDLKDISANDIKDKAYEVKDSLQDKAEDFSDTV
jgi:hypothetical protein